MASKNKTPAKASARKKPVTVDPVGERLERLNHERFAQMYVTLNNATRAYAAVYDVSDEVAGPSGHNLLKNSKVRARIAQLLDADLEAIEITRSRLTQALARRAAAAAEISLDDITDAIAAGRRLTREQRLAIKKRKSGQHGEEFELWDPTPMIAQLAKLGGWDAPTKVEVKAEATVTESKVSDEAREKVLAALGLTGLGDLEE